ncbi:large conductance mechanosensitive channel protein MscL [Snodgrassella alvi]|uniref:Large-conductance mechanosensitive channel n=1 Tax=Snodgrassella alvi TaxID=1196083 RepID=A0A855FL66_9NEIS|nr:large conductance mechanosensitive channel protein MscL [Snodgrassella alvi]PIT23804.1 mechanosensitive ion channel protein MscL [Snodgrassella alvi]PIT43161.1 mechanosensitive ion channel protein MscL [Snodgrassella alvi]PIT58549.1 mechanosensitive ion channel protein MscL [Snodgrassella alvi]
MKFFEQFKAFLLRGNVIDLAVGMVVGTAFTNMVKSLVDNVIMPPIGLLIGGVDFSNLFITLRNGSKSPGPYETLGAAQAAGAVTLNIGLFINTVISLIIIGFAIFMIVKAINKLHKNPPPKTTTKQCPQCCTDIPLEAKRCPNCTSELN